MCVALQPQPFWTTSPSFWGRRGLAAARYDVDLDKDSMDFTSVFLVCKQSEAGYYMIMKFSNISKISPWLFSPRLGLLVALQYVLRMAPGSLLYSGLPCSLHVWIARGTSLKTRCNPRGNLLKSCVREANLIACRFSMVVLVCLVRQIWHLTEQPGSSVARHLPYLELALHPDRMMMGFQSSLCQYLYHVFIQDVCDFTVPSAPKCHFGGERNLFLHVETKLDGTIWASFIEEEYGIWNHRGWVEQHDRVWNNHICAHWVWGTSSLWEWTQFIIEYVCRCWAHMLSLQARLTKADREEHRWSSAGNTKVTRNRQGKVTNVSFGFTITSHYIVDSVGKQHDSIIFHVLQCPWVLWFPRSGGQSWRRHNPIPQSSVLECVLFTRPGALKHGWTLNSFDVFAFWSTWYHNINWGYKLRPCNSRPPPAWTWAT